MKTKYVRSRDGLFVLFSERLGVQHYEMAGHIANASSIRDGGFVYLNDHGRFVVYGQSLSLGISANPETSDEINAAFDAGELRLYPFFDLGLIATNADRGTDFELAQSLESLYDGKIIRRN